MDKVKVELVGTDDKVVAVYHVFQSNIAANVRRINLLKPILEDDELDDVTKTTLANCASLATCLYDEKGKNLVFSGDDAAQQIYESLPIDHFAHLINVYVELNPQSNDLKAKKKKY